MCLYLIKGSDFQEILQIVLVLHLLTFDSQFLCLLLLRHVLFIMFLLLFVILLAVQILVQEVIQSKLLGTSCMLSVCSPLEFE